MDGSICIDSRRKARVYKPDIDVIAWVRLSKSTAPTMDGLNERESEGKRERNKKSPSRKAQMRVQEHKSRSG